MNDDDDEDDGPNIFDLKPVDYIRDLRDRLMAVPGGHGVDQGDCDRLTALIDEVVDVTHMTPKGEHEVRAHVKGAIEPASDETYPVPRGGWNCFHCGGHYTTIKGARLHFGETPDGVARCVADAAARSWRTVGDPIVTFTVEVDADGNIANDTVTHGSTFAEVYAAFPKILAEVQRQIDERRECPFNPAFGQSAREAL